MKATGQLAYDAKLAPLRTLCRKRKLPAYGSKSDLLARLKMDGVGSVELLELEGAISECKMGNKSQGDATSGAVVSDAPPLHAECKRRKISQKARSPTMKTPYAGRRYGPRY